MLAELTDAFSLALHSLQHGARLEVLVKALVGTCFEPSGVTDTPRIPVVSSVIDHVARSVMASTSVHD